MVVGERCRRALDRELHAIWALLCSFLSRDRTSRSNVYFLTDKPSSRQASDTDSNWSPRLKGRLDASDDRVSILIVEIPRWALVVAHRGGARSITTTSSGTESTMSLRAEQILALEALERAGASLSMVGSFAIFITYWKYKRLRTVPNTFILFASVANVGASVACLIGYDGIRAGESSFLCQLQAFLLEMYVYTRTHSLIFMR